MGWCWPVGVLRWWVGFGGLLMGCLPGVCGGVVGVGCVVWGRLVAGLRSLRGVAGDRLVGWCVGGGGFRLLVGTWPWRCWRAAAGVAACRRVGFVVR